MSDNRSVHHLLVAETRGGSVTRRRMLLGLVGLAAAISLARSRATRASWRAPDTASRDDWRAFAARFIAPEGRVVDTGNGGVTHSEGQGYGLLFAEHFDDRATFDSLLAWTQGNLRRRGDALHAWRYKPNASVPVDDANNATDGDLLIAWALLRAGQTWRNQDYTDLGSAIAADILANCVRKVGDITVLLPAAFGFEHPGRVVVNPSYYIFPALQALGDAVPEPTWDALQADGLRILQRAAFGRWRLPPDWLEIANGSLDAMAPARDWPTRFSWDAVRVPLNLAWAGMTTEPALGAAADFWASPSDDGIAAWADLATDAVAPYPACRGVTAVARVVRAARAGTIDAVLPRVGDAEDYYSSALVLLARVACHECRDSVAAA